MGMHRNILAQLENVWPDALQNITMQKLKQLLARLSQPGLRVLRSQLMARRSTTEHRIQTESAIFVANIVNNVQGLIKTNAVSVNDIITCGIKSVEITVLKAAQEGYIRAMLAIGSESISIRIQLFYQPE